MTPIPPANPRLLFLRKNFNWATVIPPLIIAFFVVIGAIGLYRQFSPPSVTRLVLPSSAPLQEMRSADGKVICYAHVQAISCLPAWLLDRPENWMLYAKPREKK